MRGREVAFLGSTPCGEDVRTFRFERPEGYEFIPGQHFMLQLRVSEGPAAKPFSHAAAPGDDWLEVTTHVSDSPFKQALAALEPGDSVWAGDPVGRLALPTPQPPVVFLVGGIGITPARSIVRDAVQRQTGLGATLLYGNRSIDCIPYRDELDSYSRDGIECVHILEHPPSDWTGESGFITPDLVARVTDTEGRLFVTAGPPGMVAAMESCMDALNIDAEDRLVERFAGY